MMNIFFIICDEKKNCDLHHNTAQLSHSSRRSRHNPEDDDIEEDPEDLEEEEEEVFVQHDQVTQGLISYDTVHKQLATASKKDSADLDYEFEGE